MYDILIKKMGQHFPKTFLKCADFEGAQKQLRNFARIDLTSKDNLWYICTQDDADDFNYDNIDPNMPNYKFEGPGWYSASNGESVYLEENINDDNFKSYTYDNYVYYISEEYFLNEV